MNVKKTPVVMKERVVEQSVSNDTQRPKNPLANVFMTKPKPPTEGYVLEVDGKFKSDYETSAAAMKAGLELKKRYPHIQVKVYDSKERTRALVELAK